MLGEIRNMIWGYVMTPKNGYPNICELWHHDEEQALPRLCSVHVARSMTKRLICSTKTILSSSIPAYRLWILWIRRTRFLQFERPYNRSPERIANFAFCFILTTENWYEKIRYDFSPIARMHNLRRLNISIEFETPRWIFKRDDQEFLDSYLRPILRWIPKHVHPLGTPEWYKALY